MENRSEHLLLKPGLPGHMAASILLVLSLLLPQLVLAQDTDDSEKPAPVQVIAPEVKPRSIQEADIDAEFFEIGAFAGMLSIDNFSSEPLLGVSAAFHATEDFFLQFNYGFAEAGLTSFEELSGSNVRLLTDDDRNYSYYDFLVGYNIFPGEIFFHDSLTVHVDFRDHMFESDLIRESQLTHNIELSSGFTLFF